MQKQVVSLQFVLVAIVLTMAISGIGLLIFNSLQYQDLVHKNKQNSVTNYLKNQSKHLIESSIREITDVTMKLQSKTRFRNALHSQSTSILTRILDNEFNQYVFTTGGIGLQRIYVLDKDMNLVAKSRKGAVHKSDDHVLCERVLDKANIRVGSERLKTLHMLCDDNELAHLAILNTVGSFKPQGYLLYIVDPASVLSSLGSRLGMATQILNPNGSVAHATADWESEAYQDQSNKLNVYHAIKNDNRKPVLFINVLHDLKDFNASLKETEKSSLYTATFIFCLALALSFVLLNAVMKALRAIREGANSLSNGNFLTVDRTRFFEFNVLIDAFNGMATDISALIKKLNVAKQNSDQANQSKSVFLANMSHEIRTPMNAVLGYTQILLRDRELPQEYRRPLESVEKAGNHLLALINDILDLSKIEAGAIELHPEDFSVHELVEGLSEMFEFRCKQNGLDWKINNEITGDGLVYGDHNKLRQVLMNFLSNAVKFTIEGGVTLSVREREEFYDFKITDTGMGISSADMMNVLKPFQQAEAGIKKGGTGLGLAISKRQLEIMGSELHMLSNPGQGSTFSFSICLPPAHNAVRSRRSENNISQRVLQQGKLVDALVVDDVEDNRQVLGQLLKSSGVMVRTAVNGEEALRQVHAQAPDIVFMDIRMPVMSGTEAMEKIKREFPDVVCVAVTSSVFYHERAGYMEKGFDDLIGKPFRFEKIIECMEAFLDVTFVESVPETIEVNQQSMEKPAINDIRDICVPKNLYSMLKEAVEVNAITDMELVVEELKKLNDETRYLAALLEKHINNYATDDIANILEEVRCA
jgi:signal transduction histidine kinase/CheY-like chemotaxis protein